MRILAITVAVVVLGTAVSAVPASLGGAQSNQVGTLLTFDFPGESKKKKGLKAKSPKGKPTEGGNSSYRRPKWSDIQLKR